MKVILYRNGTWYQGLCLDEITIEMRKENSIDKMYQQDYELKRLGYELEDRNNNPFKETTQFEYFNEYKDTVVVRVDYKNTKMLQILKQYNNIENCKTTLEVLVRLGALHKLHEDIINIFRKQYGGKVE